MAKLQTFLPCALEKLCIEGVKIEHLPNFSSLNQLMRATKLPYRRSSKGLQTITYFLVEKGTLSIKRHSTTTFVTRFIPHLQPINALPLYSRLIISSPQESNISALPYPRWDLRERSNAKFCKHTLIASKHAFGGEFEAIRIGNSYALKNSGMAHESKGNCRPQNFARRAEIFFEPYIHARWE